MLLPFRIINQLGTYVYQSRISFCLAGVKDTLTNGHYKFFNFLLSVEPTYIQQLIDNLQYKLGI